MKTLLVHLAFAVAGTGIAFGQASQQQQPFTLRIAADLPFKGGSNMFIRITETNTSDHVVNCTAYDAAFTSDLSFTYNVRDDHGRPLKMRPDAYNYAVALRRCALSPGKSNSREHLISWLFNLIPGKYPIQVSRKADDDGDSFVRSNVISFEVTE